MVSFSDADGLDVLFHRVREKVPCGGDTFLFGGCGDHEPLTCYVSNKSAPPQQACFRVIPRIGWEAGFEVFDFGAHGMWSGNIDVSCPKLASMQSRSFL